MNTLYLKTKIVSLSRIIHSMGMMNLHYKRNTSSVMLIISLDLCGSAEKLKITIMLGISLGIRYSCFVFCSEIMYLPGYFSFDFNF